MYMVWLRSSRNDFIALDRSEDMSVHVKAGTDYDLNALTPVVRKLWR
jgi:hypothetical protein